MSRRWATIFFVVVLLVTVASLLRVWWAGRREVEEEPLPVVVEQPAEPRQVEEDQPTREVVLYFPSSKDVLAPEIRTVVEEEDLEAQAAAVLEALLTGPEMAGHFPPLPPEVKLGGVYLGNRGKLYLDLQSELSRPPATGSRVELLVVGSLVESVLANLPELDSVVLLWNGVQRESFAGHLDTSRPLRGGFAPIESAS